MTAVVLCVICFFISSTVTLSERSSTSQNTGVPPLPITALEAPTNPIVGIITSNGIVLCHLYLFLQNSMI